VTFVAWYADGRHRFLWAADFKAATAIARSTEGLVCLFPAELSA
jgi:hypothetical protein